MATQASHKFETLQLYAGQEVYPVIGSRAVPIYQSTFYFFNSSEHGANLFALKEFGNIYTGITNPTTDVFKKRIAALATSSGQAAQFIALNYSLQTGCNLVTSPFIYGGSYHQFKVGFKRLGVEARFVKDDKAAGTEALINDKTKANYTETI